VGRVCCCCSTQARHRFIAAPPVLQPRKPTASSGGPVAAHRLREGPARRAPPSPWLQLLVGDISYGWRRVPRWGAAGPDHVRRRGVCGPRADASGGQRGRQWAIDGRWGRTALARALTGPTGRRSGQRICVASCNVRHRFSAGLTNRAPMSEDGCPRCQHGIH